MECRLYMDVRINSNLCSASVIVVLCTISCYTGLRYNGTDSIMIACNPNKIVNRVVVMTAYYFNFVTDKTGVCWRTMGYFSPVTGEFPAQRTSNAENVSIWWRHHDQNKTIIIYDRLSMLRRHRPKEHNSDISTCVFDQKFAWSKFKPFDGCVYCYDSLVLYQLRQPRMLCCHCLPPDSLHVLGAFESLS